MRWTASIEKLCRRASPEGDLTAMRRARLLVYANLVGLMAGLVFGGLAGLGGNMPALAVAWTGFAAVCVNLFAWTRHLQTARAAAISLGIVSASIVALIALLGGISTPWSALLYPLAVVIWLRDRGNHARWAQGLIAGLALLVALEATGVITPDSTPPSVSRVVLIGGLHMLAISFTTVIMRVLSAQFRNSERALIETTKTLEETSRALSEARDAALAALETRTQLMTNVSHELRTPLNGILGSLTLLRYEVNTPELLERVQLVEQSTALDAELAGGLEVLRARIDPTPEAHV